ncbi:DUF1080 domain-containing protein [bacterium]|nr:DUF1080 domain-containing protein [bacterium]
MARHVGAAALLAVLLSGCAPKSHDGGATGGATAKPAAPASVTWTSLFDGRALGDWAVVKKNAFDVHGHVEVKDGSIVMKTGIPYTGIVRAANFPKSNYEIEIEGTRLTGVEIFLGLTFPVGDAHVTLVCGGWGDSVVGLSNIDDLNANDNEYVVIRGFDNNKWVKARVRVTDEKVLVWIDEKKIIEVPVKKHKFTVYPDLLDIRPLGFFTWETEGAVRNIRYRELTDEEKDTP